MALPISPTRRALLALAAGGVLFGLTVPLSKIALGWLDPAWLAVARFGLAAPALAWVARRRLRAALSLRVVAWGGLGYGAMVLLQNAGLERTSAGHAALLCGAVPALVACGGDSGGRERRRSRRAWCWRPRLLMLDEPSAGLSPVLVDRVLNVIAQLRKQGTAVLLVEQLLEKALAAADRVYALVQGNIVLEAPTSESNLAQRLEHAYFGHESHALSRR